MTICHSKLDRRIEAMNAVTDAESLFRLSARHIVGVVHENANSLTRAWFCSTTSTATSDCRHWRRGVFWDEIMRRASMRSKRFWICTMSIPISNNTPTTYWRQLVRTCSNNVSISSNIGFNHCTIAFVNMRK
jgi:hypothetical protein